MRRVWDVLTLRMEKTDNYCGILFSSGNPPTPRPAPPPRPLPLTPYSLNALTLRVMSETHVGGEDRGGLRAKDGRVLAVVGEGLVFLPVAGTVDAQEAS